MPGDLLGVWRESWRAIWEPLALDAPVDLFCELYPELVTAMVSPPDEVERERIVNDAELAGEAFCAVEASDLIGEGALVGFFENAHAVVEVFDADPVDFLANEYFGLLDDFIETYSLGYALRRPSVRGGPCRLSPTLPGVFTDLWGDVRRLCATDTAHLAGLLEYFEVAFRDFYDHREDLDYRVTTFVSQYTNLLEGLGKRHPNVPAGNDKKKPALGYISDKVGTWPDEHVKAAMMKLWTFANDYPGIRHSGTPSTSQRKLEVRDFVALAIVLTGFVPYLSDEIDLDSRYRGG